MCTCPQAVAHRSNVVDAAEQMRGSMLKLAQATNEVLVPRSALWGYASAGPLARSAARPCKHPSGGAKQRNLVETVHTLGSSLHAVQHIPVVRHFLAQTNSRDVVVILQNNDGVQVRLRGEFPSARSMTEEYSFTTNSAIDCSTLPSPPTTSCPPRSQRPR